MDLTILDNLTAPPVNILFGNKSTPNGYEQPPLSDLFTGVTEGGRNQSAARVAAKLISAHMNEEDVLSLMSGWNLLNSPPMDEAEVRQVVRSMFKTHTRNQLKGFGDDQQQKSSVEFISFKEMMERQVQTEWLIKDYITQQSINLLFGETGSMKSFLVIDMGLCVATGTDWHGHKVKTPGPVFYICGEGFAGVAKRLKAWQLERGIKHE